METVNLTFPAPFNMSCKVGDLVYYVDTTSSFQGSGFMVGADNYQLIGAINSIITLSSEVIINVQLTGPTASLVSTTDFIFFVKNNLVETGSIKGYFSKVKYRNNSTKPAEMFQTACEIEESSK